MKPVRSLVALSSALIAACGGGGGGGNDSGGTTPTPSPPAAVAKPFVDVTGASNIAYVVGITVPPGSGKAQEVAISTFGGAAAGDCDGDGDIDLFITYGDTDGNGPGGPNRLYLNRLVEQGNGLSFIDTAVAAGVANTRLDGRGNDRHSGPVFVDLDGDGDLDLFVGGLYSDPNKIYENQGDCTFVDITANSPEIEQITENYSRAVHTISAAFGDYDLDGDLDMFLTHWATPDALYGDPRTRETDHLWRNELVESGTLRFVNVSDESGIADITWATRIGTTQGADFTFTPTFARLDGDLWPDIAIAGDFGTTQIALNNGDGTFRNLSNPVLQDAQWGMGSALGDVDDDGDLDWFVTSIFGPGDVSTTPLGNRFFTNVGGASLFADGTAALGVGNGSWGWGACLLDIDNDTDLDIYHTNGWPRPFLGAAAGFYDNDTSRAFLQNAAGSFGNGAVALGLDDSRSGRSVVCADFDHDGDEDILEMTDAAGNSAILWENRSAAAGSNFLRVRLVGLPPNTEAAGARIHVRIGTQTQMREVMIGGNFAAQHPTVQIFGLGAASLVDELRVEWPAVDSGSGPVQPETLITSGDARLNASASGSTLTLRHPDLPPL